MTVTINGTTGYTGPIGAIGDLSTTGNTTLGDASGDTLTINGSTTTFTQGTANGVAYLNGSKVLTTGSALVFDGSNMGVGVTPSAWGSNYKAIESAAASNFVLASANVNPITLVCNGYATNSGFLYKTTGAASLLNVSNGSFQFFNAGSGTAGNAITFTQAMTLDASGNLAIGATSASYRLEVSAVNTADVIRLMRTSTSTGAGPGMDFSVTQTNSQSARLASIGTEFLSAWGGALTFFTKTANGNPDTSITERARIDSSGNLLVGTTSSTFKLNVTSSGGDVASFNAGAAGQLLRLSQSSANSVIFRMNNSSNNFWDTQVNTDNSITWDYNDAERARITSGGSLGIANSNPSYLVDVGSNSGNAAFFRAEGSFIVRKYSFNNNGTTAITLRLTILNNGLQFSNFFMDASAHYFNNGGSWQVFRYAFQFMNEGGTLRHNIRMPNYEYGGSTSGVFTVGNPPSWTYDGGGGWYFDFTVAGGFVSYITLTSQGPGIRNLTLTAL